MQSGNAAALAEALGDTPEDTVMPTYRKRIGARFKESRNAVKISQEDAARQLHLSQQAISSWESGSRMPTATQLSRLATLYGTPADYLLFGIRTVPVALLRGKNDEQCFSLASLREGFRSLVKALVKA